MSKEHQIPRIDPENRMGLNFHAPRAMTRFQSIASPEGKRVAIADAKFRNTGVHEGEVDAIKAAMLRKLDLIEGRRTPEQEQLLKMLENQTETAAKVWTERYPLPNAPKTGRLIEEGRKWLASLPPETLNGLLALSPETAQFVVVPDSTVPKQIELIGGKIWWSEGWNKMKSGKWKFGITNGAEDLPFDPAIFYKSPDAPEKEKEARTNEKMVAEYAQLYQANGLQLMPQHGYVPSVANALAQGRVLDRQFYTAFERPGRAAFLPDGGWSFGQVLLDGCYPDASNFDLRCRPWVEGEMSA